MNRTFEDIWKLNPNGNKESAKSYIQIFINPANCMTTGDGETPTIDFFYNQYKSYLQWWKANFGKTEVQYLGKNKKKDLSIFLSDNTWKENFSKDPLGRDQYLFGNMDKQEMIKKTKEFMKNAGTRK